MIWGRLSLWSKTKDSLCVIKQEDQSIRPLIGHLQIKNKEYQSYNITEVSAS